MWKICLKKWILLENTGGISKYGNAPYGSKKGWEISTITTLILISVYIYHKIKRGNKDEKEHKQRNHRESNWCNLPSTMARTQYFSYFVNCSGSKFCFCCHCNFGVSKLMKTAKELFASMLVGLCLLITTLLVDCLAYYLKFCLLTGLLNLGILWIASKIRGVKHASRWFKTNCW